MAPPAWVSRTRSSQMASEKKPAARDPVPCGARRGFLALAVVNVMQMVLQYGYALSRSKPSAFLVLICALKGVAKILEQAIDFVVDADHISPFKEGHGATKSINATPPIS